MNEIDSNRTEKARTSVVSIEEIKPDQIEELQAISDILNDPINAIHFTQAAKTVDALQKLAARPDYHLLGARNQLGELVGTFSIIDEQKDVNTHLIEKTAVRSDLHSKGVGRQMFEKAIQWCFETPTYQDRMRKILVVWVEEDLPGWERMQALIYNLGFIQMLREPDLVVKVIDGVEVEKPAARYHLRRDRYEERRPRRREEREFFDLGGTIREADLSKDAVAVNDLYVQPSAIEHFADITPSNTPKDVQGYYEIHPESQLLVAELAGEIVGVATIAPEEGLNSVKINKLVRRADKPGLGIAHHLIGEALVRSFLKKPKGYGAASVTIGVIIDIEGSDEARKAFKRFEFETLKEIKDRCSGWSKEENKIVPRKVEMMMLDRDKYAYMPKNL